MRKVTVQCTVYTECTLLTLYQRGVLYVGDVVESVMAYLSVGEWATRMRS